MADPGLATGEVTSRVEEVRAGAAWTIPVQRVRPAGPPGPSFLRRHRRVLAVALVLLALAATTSIAIMSRARVYEDRFVPAGQPKILRRLAVPVVLADGRVLLLGGLTLLGAGRQEDPGLRSELFDPRDGSFTLTGPLVEPRSTATVIRLRDGRVLVVGGVLAQGEPILRAELFDPRLGTFSAAGPMAIPRTDPVLTLLRDGRVLVLAGRDATGAIVERPEAFDPLAGRFALVGPKAAAGGALSTTVLDDGRVLVVGGRGSDGSESVYVFNPGPDTFAPVGPSVVGRQDVRNLVTLQDGRVFIAGSAEEGLADPGLQRYMPASWELPVVAELFDPRTNQLRPVGPRMPGRGPTIIPISDGRLLVIGGEGDRRSRIARGQVYDPRADSLTVTGPMSTPRFNATSLTLQDGRLLLIGGFDERDGRLLTAETFDPRSGRFAAIGSMATPRFAPSVLLLDDGRVFISNGQDEVRQEVIDVELFE